MLIFGLLLFPLGWIDNAILAVAILLLTGMISGVVNIYIEGYLQRLTEGETGDAPWAPSLRRTAH
ncbi:hypothetical protein [Bacillus swezeyi]|uniref:hypothetical protein n=1 Tax=Bacillus swezeyi TaxID=1925020 RepID=UPI0027DAE275|nr:hypothetical protein [Bacillus swezeyi]